MESDMVFSHEIAERRMMTHECEWLSECCGAEPATDLDSEMEGVSGICAQCREGSSFNCVDHPIGEDYVVRKGVDVK